MSSADLFLANRLDYLQRIGFVPPPMQLTPQSLTTCAPHGGSLMRINGIGRHEKSLIVPPASFGNTEWSGREHLLCEDMLIGLHGHQLPLIFFIHGDLDHIALSMGTWVPLRSHAPSSATSVTPTVVQKCQDVLKAVLRSLYPVVHLEPSASIPTQPFWPDIQSTDLHAGFALGVPTIKPIDPRDGALPLDRLVRGLAGSRWAIMIMAEPVGEGVISRLRNQVINETQAITVASHSSNTPDPLKQTYSKLLEVMLASFTQGQCTGMWRTATYLLGDRSGYYHLASLWRSTFSGEHSLPDPVRVWEQPAVIELASRWAMSNDLAPRQEGYIQHAFQYQTLLTSQQLAAYVHLPNLEVNGFSIQMIPDFDVTPPAVTDTPSLSLGNIIHHTRITPVEYKVSRKSLTRHTFVAGLTGSGKTNTILHLLQQCNVPFLVIEPAKTEYRILLRHKHLNQNLSIFTLGDETTSPFRFNPFEVLPQTSVSTHIDLLRSVFVASFGLWSPLPQLLERCLHRIYRDRGWDLLTNTNQRLGSASPADYPEVFPTLSDLVAAVNDVLNELDYEKQIKGNMQTALLVRLQALCIGGKGAMLNVQRSFPIERLLEQPTILELEGMGDDDDRALMMGLILIRLYEYRRAQGQIKDLQHLLVIEEAHRLLANVGEQRREEEANPRGKAVETFANLLSEIRAFGQGVIIADQVPVKLAPDVIKNTNLKIVHRIVAQDDRAELAGAMAMNEKQAIALSTQTEGQAVVFSEGDDVPVQIKVEKVKGRDSDPPLPNNEQIRQYMTQRGSQELLQLSLPFATCAGSCSTQRSTCQVAQQIVASVTFQRAFTRVVLSIMEEMDALDHMWEDILVVMRAHRPVKTDEQKLMKCLLTRAAHWFVERCGTQANWSYAETREMAKVLRQVLLNKHTQADPEPARIAFQQCVRKLHARDYDPYPFCHRICQQQPPMCFYRPAVADLVTSGRMKTAWETAYEQDNIQSPNGRPQQLLNVINDAGYELIEFPENTETSHSFEAQRRVCLCFAQQMLITDADKILSTARRVLLRLIQEA